MLDINRYLFYFPDSRYALPREIALDTQNEKHIPKSVGFHVEIRKLDYVTFIVVGAITLFLVTIPLL